MLLDQGSQLGLIVRPYYPTMLGQPLDIDELRIDPIREAAILIQHIGSARGHAGCEVAADGPQHHHDAAGHVLATVIPGAFDHRGRAAVPDSEPFTGSTRCKQAPTSRSIEHRVPHDDVFAGDELGFLRGDDNDLTATHALAYVVVRLAL